MVANERFGTSVPCAPRWLQAGESPAGGPVSSVCQLWTSVNCVPNLNLGCPQQRDKCLLCVWVLLMGLGSSVATRTLEVDCPGLCGQGGCQFSMRGEVFLVHGANRVHGGHPADALPNGGEAMSGVRGISLERLQKNRLPHSSHGQR